MSESSLRQTRQSLLSLSEQAAAQSAELAALLYSAPLSEQAEAVRRLTLSLQTHATKAAEMKRRGLDLSGRYERLRHCRREAECRRDRARVMSELATISLRASDMHDQLHRLSHAEDEKGEEETLQILTDAHDLYQSFPEHAHDLPHVKRLHAILTRSIERAVRQAQERIEDLWASRQIDVGQLQKDMRLLSALAEDPSSAFLARLNELLVDPCVIRRASAFKLVPSTADGKGIVRWEIDRFPANTTAPDYLLAILPSFFAFLCTLSPLFSKRQIHSLLQPVQVSVKDLLARSELVELEVYRKICEEAIRGSEALGVDVGFEDMLGNFDGAWASYRVARALEDVRTCVKDWDWQFVPSTVEVEVQVQVQGQGQAQAAVQPSAKPTSSVSAQPPATKPSSASNDQTATNVEDAIIDDDAWGLDDAPSIPEANSATQPSSSPHMLPIPALHLSPPVQNDSSDTSSPVAEPDIAAQEPPKRILPKRKVASKLSKLAMKRSASASHEVDPLERALSRQGNDSPAEVPSMVSDQDPHERSVRENKAPSGLERLAAKQAANLAENPSVDALQQPLMAHDQSTPSAEDITEPATIRKAESPLAETSVLPDSQQDETRQETLTETRHLRQTCATSKSSLAICKIYQSLSGDADAAANPVMTAKLLEGRRMLLQLWRATMTYIQSETLTAPALGLLFVCDLLYVSQTTDDLDCRFASDVNFQAILARESNKITKTLDAADFSQDLSLNTTQSSIKSALGDATLHIERLSKDTTVQILCFAQ